MNFKNWKICLTLQIYYCFDDMRLMYFGSQTNFIQSSTDLSSIPIIFHQSLIYVLRVFGFKRPLNNRLNGLLSIISRKSSPLHSELTATFYNHRHNIYCYKARGTMPDLRHSWRWDEVYRVKKHDLPHYIRKFPSPLISAEQFLQNWKETNRYICLFHNFS